MALNNEKELHLACKEGDHDKLQYLLQAETRAYTFDKKGFPPIAVAASHGNATCIQFLLEMGKNVNIEMETRNSGETALCVAISSYRSFSALSDTQGEEQIARNNRKRTAKNKKLLHVLKTLLAQNADMASPRRFNKTPLHIACTRGFYGAVELLLPCSYTNAVGEVLQVSVHALDSSNRTPLHFAAKNGHSDIVRLLLRWGANPVARNNYDVSPLHNAISNGYSDTVRVIFQDFPNVFEKAQQKHHILLLQQEIHRKIEIKTSQLDQHKKDGKQSVFAVAQDNAQLLDVLIRGPDCLTSVIHFNWSLRPEIVMAQERRRKRKRKRRREQRRVRERNKRIGKLNILPKMGSALDGVIWEEEDPGPKHKPETYWLYQDKSQGNAVLGPVPNSTMRGWYYSGKLPLELLVYKLPEQKDSALTNEPPPPSILNMAARGQGPFASGPSWSPQNYPHKQRQLPNNIKFRALRHVLSEHGGPEYTWGKPSNIGSLFATKLMAKKWRNQSKGTKKFLREPEYNSDESSGIEENDDIDDRSWDEMEEERIEMERKNQHVEQERQQIWIDSNFINEYDSITKKTPLAIACENGWFDAAAVLLDVGDSRVDQTDRYGYTPLNLASKKGHLSIVNLLLTYPRGVATIATKDNSYHWAPLVWAASQGYLDIARALLAAGADVENYRIQKTWWQAGALGVASCKRGNQLVVKELIKAGADVNRVGGESSRITPMHAAAARGNSNIVHALLDSGNADLDARDYNTSTALMLACRGGHLRCARLLMDLGADWHLQSSGGWTALMYAAEGGYSKIVYRMLHWKKKPRTTNGIDTLNVPPSLQIATTATAATTTTTTTTTATTATTATNVPTLPAITVNLAAFGVAKLAARRVHERAAQAVVDNNNGIAPTTQHIHGIAYTPSQNALVSQFGSNTTSLASQSSASKPRKKKSFFNTQGSKLSRHKLALVSCQETHTSCNALHMACRYGHTTVLSHLLKCKLPLDVLECRSGTEQTPLGVACYFGHFDCVELMLKYGSEMNARQGDLTTGPTPLMHAASQGFVQIVRILLPIADTELLNAHNQNCGQLAAAHGHKAIFQYITAERKIRERKRASELRAEYERVEAIEAADKKAKEDRQKKEQEYRNAMIKKNKEIEKERLRVLAEEEKKNKTKKKKPKKKQKKKKKNTKVSKKKKKNTKKVSKKKKK